MVAVQGAAPLLRSVAIAAGGYWTLASRGLLVRSPPGGIGRHGMAMFPVRLSWHVHMFQACLKMCSFVVRRFRVVTVVMFAWFVMFGVEVFRRGASGLHG